MSVTAKTLKNGKKQISSTWFDTIKLYKDTVDDTYRTTSYKERHTTLRSTIEEIKLKAVVQQLIAARNGCWEVAEYVRQYKGDASEIVPNYGPAQPYESYDDLKKELNELEALPEKSARDLSRIDAISKEIKDIDDFVDLQLERAKSNIEDDFTANTRRGTIW